MLTRSFKIGMNAGHIVTPVIHVNQYDHDEQWIFTLVDDNGVVYTPTTGGIVGLKADGNVILNAGTVNSSGQVVINETQQMTAAAGDATYELLLDNSTHGCANFTVRVEPKPGDNATYSDSDLSLLQEAIDSTNPEHIADSVQDWMDDNLAPSQWVIDNTLRIAGAAADAKKTGDGLNELKTDLNQILVSNNPELNNIIKEMYIPTEANVDLSTATKVRVYNGLAGMYGFRIYNSSNTLLLGVTSTADISTKIYYSSVNGVRAYYVIGDLSLTGGEYKDYPCSINNCIHERYSMPIISGYLNTIESLEEPKANINLLLVSNNPELNNILKEIYFTPSLAVSSIKMVRVYNGSSSMYGFRVYDTSNNIVFAFTQTTLPSAGVYLNRSYLGIKSHFVLGDISSINATYKDYVIPNTVLNSGINDLKTMPILYSAVNYATQDEVASIVMATPTPSNIPTKGQVLYNADTSAQSNYINNAVAYDDGVIIACRSNGKVVRIGYSGSETELLSLTGYIFDWRLCWKDSNDNIYVSPHTTRGSMNVSDRGLYRLVKGGNSFTKVISLYNPSSTIPTEAEENNDTIWTMCEDDEGNLYAGVYAHTTHANPSIYKSIDGGVTWTYLYNFVTSGDTPTGRHIHSIIYSKWQKALYTIVGEVNKIWKSTDGGTTWSDIGVTLPYDKGSSMLPLPYGILIGSDGAYNCALNLLHNDDTTYKTVYVGWANTVFAIRRSDITGFIYAFCKIDSSALSQKYFPPYSVLSLSGEEQEEAIQTWRYSDANPLYTEWLAYRNSVEAEYPNDAIIPTHYAILISRDGGNSFEVLKRYASATSGPDGFWTTGEFINGEILTGHLTSATGFINPVVISEGKHKYVSTGCDLSGEIFVRTNTSAIVEVL